MAMKKLIRKRRLPPKKLARRKWTFDQKRDQEMLWEMARSGLGNAAIMRETGFTLGQISYARQLLKAQLGLEHSLYNSWRLGVVPYQIQMMRMVHGIRMAELREQVVPKLVHPTPVTINLKDK